MICRHWFVLNLAFWYQWENTVFLDLFLYCVQNSDLKILIESYFHSRNDLSKWKTAKIQVLHIEFLKKRPCIKRCYDSDSHLKMWVKIFFLLWKLPFSRKFVKTLLKNHWCQNSFLLPCKILKLRHGIVWTSRLLIAFSKRSKSIFLNFSVKG